MEEKYRKAYDFTLDWTAGLLDQICERCGEEDCAALLQSCAAYHYRRENMDELISTFHGDIDGFIAYVEKEWGWVVLRPENDVILIDENKEFCVCPITAAMKDRRIHPVLCHCSEGFAKLMYGKLTGRPVKAKVVSSILRGDKHCVYRIELL